MQTIAIDTDSSRISKHIFLTHSFEIYVQQLHVTDWQVAEPLTYIKADV